MKYRAEPALSRPVPPTFAFVTRILGFSFGVALFLTPLVRTWTTYPPGEPATIGGIPLYSDANNYYLGATNPVSCITIARFDAGFFANQG